MSAASPVVDCTGRYASSCPSTNRRPTRLRPEAGVETPQQQGAIATDDQREMAALQDRRDRVSNTGDERTEAVRIDDVRPRVARR